MKRFLSFLIVASLLFTCVFAITGCSGGGDDQGNIPDPTISEEAWGSINDQGFIVETLGCVVFKLDGTSYETYSISGEYSYVDKSYLSGLYEIAKEGGVWQPLKQIDQSVNQNNLFGLKAIIEFVKTNRESFTFENNKYTMAIEGETLASEIENVKSVVKRSNFIPTAIQVEKETFFVKALNQDKSIIKIVLVGEKGGLDNIEILLNTPILQYDLDKKLESLTNFYIKGGPSLDDVDYVETYFTQDGFRVYSPNNPDPLRRDAYLRYDATENKYYEYRQNAQGNWYVEETTASIYNNTKESTFDMYMGNFLKQSESFVCDYANSSRCYSKETISHTNAQGTWSYFNISIVTGNVFNLHTATWNMQLKVGEAQSLVYNISFCSGSVVLEYPQVA